MQGVPVNLSLDALVQLVTTAGPATILALMWYLEYKERKRLQSVIESYFIPTMVRTEQVLRNLRRVVAGELSGKEGDDDDGK